MKRLLVSFAAVLAALFVAGTAGPAQASAPRAAAPGFVLGVVPQQPLGSEDMQLMRSGSIDSFRLWINWSEIQSLPGTLDWAVPDEAVAAAAAEGITPLPFLYGTPTWAAAADGQACSGGECVPFAPRSDVTRAAYAAFAAAAVGRYGPGGTFWVLHPELPYTPIRAWQLWLEQNSPTYFAPAPDAPSYAALVAVTGAAIRAVDPSAEVVLGGMWGTRSVGKSVVPAAAYLRRFYREPGIEASFDAIALHPYAKLMSGVVEQITAARAVAKRAGDRKAGLWVTELGWASAGPSDENLVFDPKKQAKLLRRAFLTMHRKRRAWRVRGVYWYAWRDTPSEAAICDWCPGSGLFSEAGEPKPAWLSLISLASRL